MSYNRILDSKHPGGRTRPREQTNPRRVHLVHRYRADRHGRPARAREEPDPPRDRLRALRRPRRLDQHHAADLHEPGLRGDPPRAQPFRAGGRRRRAGGGRPGRGGLVLPGRARRVLRVPRRVAARAGRRPRQGRRRGRRRDRARPRSPGCASRASRSSPPRTARGWASSAMVNSVVADCDVDLWASAASTVEQVLTGDRFAVARAITGAEGGRLDEAMLAEIRQAAARRVVPVLGITGTGGSGKSSLTDEVVRRFRTDQQDKLRDRGHRGRPDAPQGRRRAARRPDPGQLPRRRPGLLPLAWPPAAPHEVPEAPRRRDRRDEGRRPRPGDRRDARHRPGRRRHRAARRPLSLYVMTPEFGAASQLEKIDMLDFADSVAINKFERRGAKDAMRDVGRQLVRNREAFGKPGRTRCRSSAPRAATFNDDGVTALYQHLSRRARRAGLAVDRGVLPHVDVRHSSGITPGRAAERVRYLSEIAETVRGYHADDRELRRPRPRRPPARAVRWPTELAATATRATSPSLLARARTQGRPARGRRPARGLAGGRGVLLRRRAGRRGARPRDPHRLTRESLSGNAIPRVALPRSPTTASWSLLAQENLPGFFPFTAGVFAFKRDNEDPARMFAGEGDPARTNRRFKMLSERQRREAALDRVRLGDPLRPRPRPATRRLRQGRHVRRLGRDPRRHEGALRRLRPGRRRRRLCR